MFVNPKTGLPARPLPARQAAGGEVIAPVIVCLFDRERGTSTDSVVNYCQGTLAFRHRGTHREYIIYLLNVFCAFYAFRCVRAG